MAGSGDQALINVFPGLADYRKPSSRYIRSEVRRQHREPDAAYCPG